MFKINHKNLVNYLDFKFTEKCIFFIMDYCDGKDLK